MSRIAKAEVFRALEHVGEKIKDAGGADGRVSRAKTEAFGSLLAPAREQHHGDVARGDVGALWSMPCSVWGRRAHR